MLDVREPIVSRHLSNEYSTSLLGSIAFAPVSGQMTSMGDDCGDTPDILPFPDVISSPEPA